MQKHWFLIGAAMLGMACNTLREVPPVLSVGTFEHPIKQQLPDLKPTLLARYHHLQENKNTQAGTLELIPQYWGIKYLPRQSRLPGFSGWDELKPENMWMDMNRADWLRLTLSRAAEVAVIWDKDLSGWTRGADMPDGRRSYRKSLPAGEFSLPYPGKADKNKPYTVLFAESNGQPSPEPSAPTGLEKPSSNSACPAWLDGLFTAKGPNGVTHKSWHPQIDPYYWCYYGHEHGSDPSLVGYKPSFEYIALLNNDQAEIHNGFKGFSIRDSTNNLGWYFNVHSETGDIHRVCVRRHTVVVAITNLSTGELLAELGYKGDFGASKSNQDDNPVITMTMNMPGMTCDDQSKIAKETKLEKRIRVRNDPSVDRGGYESWSGGINKGLGFDFASWHNGGMSVDIRNPRTSCSDINCTSTKTNNGAGDERTIFLANLSLKYDQFKDNTDGVKDGYFYTDVYGNSVTKDTPNAVRQFVSAKLTNPASIEGFYTTSDAWRGLYVEDGHATVLELEKSLQSN